jgi:hypothetical protein
MFNLFINIYFNSLISGLVIIKLSNRIFILVLQNWPIRVKYLFDAVLLLAVFFSKYEYDLVLDSFMTISFVYILFISMFFFQSMSTISCLIVL